MNWMDLFCVVLLNSLFCLTQLIFQLLDIVSKSIPARHSIIEGSKGQKFLYWQDFLTQTWGDFLCLPLIAYAFFSKDLSAMELPIFLGFFIMTVPMVALFCMKGDHKPDWGYPKQGQISIGGISHLPYFAIYTGMIVICILRMGRGELVGLPMYLTFAGGIGWVLLWIGDFLLGHFDKFKPIEQVKKDI